MTANRLTGDDISGDENYSFQSVDVGDTLTIPDNQEMILYARMTITGDLVLAGDAKVVIL